MNPSTSTAVRESLPAWPALRFFQHYTLLHAVRSFLIAVKLRNGTAQGILGLMGIMAMGIQLRRRRHEQSSNKKPLPSHQCERSEGVSNDQS
jgi:hypothetical protein